jgi:uncharacterized membrane protein
MNGRRALWIAATLVIAALVHIGTLYAVPRLVMRRALAKMGAPNAIHFAERPTASSRGVVRPSPDMLYASCPFDLSNGALRVTARVPHSTYWSVSAFDAATNNFFVRNDSQIRGDSIEVLMLRHGQPMPPLDNALERVIVFAPSARGLVLFRTVIDDDKNVPALEAIVHQARCETLAPEPKSSNQ